MPPVAGTNPPLRLLAAFQRVYRDATPQFIVQAAGREMWVAATTRTTEGFHIHAEDLKRDVRFTWRSAKRHQTHIRRPLPAWSRYPAGVIVRLCADGLDLPGLSAVIVGAEPPGPRYDFSMGVAFATLWYEIHEATYNEDQLLALVERVRRDYVE